MTTMSLGNMSYAVCINKKNILIKKNDVEFVRNYVFMMYKKMYSKNID